MTRPLQTPGSVLRPDLPLAVVVGAGGMGTAVARRLARTHRILLADRDSARAEQVVSLLRQEGGDARPIACDVTDPDAVVGLGQRVAELGGFRVLAHVVGLSPSSGDFATIVRVDLVGAATVARVLRDQALPGAAAVFVASLAGHHITPEPEIAALLDAPEDPLLVDRLAGALGDRATPDTAYLLAKFGLIRMCRRLAPGWGARNARICSLSPGMIATEQGAVEFRDNPVKRSLYEHTPLGREGTLHEIVDALEFLVSARASFVSGVDLLVDGGLVAALAGAGAGADPHR